MARYGGLRGGMMVCYLRSHNFLHPSSRVPAKPAAGGFFLGDVPGRLLQRRDGLRRAGLNEPEERTPIEPHSPPRSV